MLMCTTWKARPLSPEQTNRMMAIWGKLEAEADSHPDTERVCWYMYGDGSGGITIADFKDPDAAQAWGVEQALALGEFLELESRPVLDLEHAMPAITAAIERMNG
jgi:hypothetical protein